MKRKSVRGRTVIITGGAGGMGAETARLLDAKGANLVLADINESGLKDTAGALSHEPLTVRCDVTSLDDVKDLVRKAVEHFGRIDALVNTAGIIIPSLFKDAGYPEIEKQVNINMMGPLRVTHEVIPELIRGGGGNIVTISSMAGIVPETYSSIYTATKFALRGLSLTLALELAPHDVAVSVIFPDTTDTPMLRFEAANGGSPLTFFSKPRAPADIAQAVYKALTRGTLEQYVPYSSGFFSKILLLRPAFLVALWPRLEKAAEGKKRAYQEKYHIVEAKKENR